MGAANSNGALLSARLDPSIARARDLHAPSVTASSGECCVPHTWQGQAWPCNGAHVAGGQIRGSK